MHSPPFQSAALDRLLHAAAPIPLLPAEVAALRSAGCEIRESSPGHFTLLRTSLTVWSEHLSAAVAHRFPQRIIEIYRQTASTQNLIRRLIESKGVAADGAIAVTDEQTAGRGRLGRKWVSPPGASVLFSRAFIAAADDAVAPESLAIRSAVAVAQALDHLLRHHQDPSAGAAATARVSIKWPNDVLIEGRKVAGILVETLPQHRAAIIGIGVNVTQEPATIPPELRDRLGSLAMFGCRADRLLVLECVLRELDRRLAPDDPPDETLAAWRTMNIHGPDQLVTFAHDGVHIRGSVMDIDLHHGLIVRTTEGQIVHLPAATTSVVV